MPNAQPIARARLIFGVVATALLAFGQVSCFDTDSIECDNGFVCPVGSRCAANQQACIFDECGDGELDPGEECDNGDITAGDGCNASCQLENCGNGRVDPDTAEVCDDGGECSDGSPCADNGDCSGIGDGVCSGTDDGNCAATCQSLNECGNMIVNAGEECDDGNVVDGDGCDTNCTFTACGNGVQTGNEACDDGGRCTDGSTNCESDLDCAGIGDGTCAPQSGDGCDADCTVSGCGNGVKSASEVCDDGRHCTNGVSCNNDLDCIGIGDQQCIPRNRDGCAANCASDESCGNDITDGAVGEVCDDGEHCANGNECDSDADCIGIGDGECRPRAGDGCNTSCTSNETCGNSIKDDAVNEVCDDGKHCTNGNPCSVNTDCTGIGDGQCTTRSGDGCSATCASDESCGNGDVDVGENCDDGKHCDDSPGAGTPGTSCTANSDCVGIGDGLCLSRDGDGCSADCLSSEGCGNGTVDVGEQCDDQNGSNQDDCVSCRINVCGDTFVDLQGPDTEDCDSGAVNAPTCDADCTVAECGDGYVNPARTAEAGPTGEQCDNLKTCENGASCTVNANCTGVGDGLCRARDDADCDRDCTVPVCGDTLVNTVAGEQCDTNLPGVSSATCNVDCTTSACHDGKLNLNAVPPEQCDDGDTDDTDECVGNCVRASCGDGFTWTGVEECDDNNATDTDDCKNDCTINVCGDGVHQTTGATTEACDDGNLVSEAECPYGTQNCVTCNAGCTAPLNLTGRFCGDSTTDGGDGEVCDDGNGTTEAACPYGVANCTACNATCTSSLNLTGNVCGDGVQDPTFEECDTTVETAACNANCTDTVCGDLYVNFEAETCDDGNAINTDACVGCEVAFCGDTFVWAGVEDCDDNNAIETDDCKSDCTFNECGDGVRQLTGTTTEMCDDGNTVTELECPYGTRNCNGCNATCTTVTNLTGSYCGDSTTDAADGEVCDDGNSISEGACAYGVASCTTCNASCTAELNLTGNVCGDNVEDGTFEQCDDAGDSVDCNANCTDSVCGDRYVNFVDGESCDDGNAVDTDACVGCTVAFCGDGNVWAGVEQCDDGNNDDNDACKNDCTFNVCGDGVLQTSGVGPEFCDDGNTTSEGSCPYGQQSCTTCNADCSAALNLTGAYCGDGVTNGGEQCDDGNLVVEASCDYGTASCTGCDNSCQDILGLTGNVCGDGVVGGPEVCDDGNTLACGLCAANCLSGGTLLAATGQVLVDQATVADGDTIVIGDGTASITFEFDDDATTGVGATPVDISGLTTTAAVRGALVTAINGSLLDITASPGGFAAVANLVNDTGGTAGNVTITTSNAAIDVSGMAGGVGNDCTTNDGCTSDDDCALTCTANQCL